MKACFKDQIALYRSDRLFLSGKLIFQISPPTEIPRCSDRMRGPTPIRVLTSSGKRLKAARRWIWSCSLSPDLVPMLRTEIGCSVMEGTAENCWASLTQLFMSDLDHLDTVFRYDERLPLVHQHYIMGENISAGRVNPWIAPCKSISDHYS